MGIHISYRPRVAVDDAATYTLTLKNESTQPWTFYVYQQAPEQTGGFSLAWFASPFVITVGSRISFDWQIAYNFVWGATGALTPGVAFGAGGEIDADLAGANQTTFSTSPGPNLSAAEKGSSPPGTLLIFDNNDVPANTFSVGIGMSGAATFVEQASPNLAHQFSPSSPPRYWVAAGTDVQVGSTVDIQTVTQSVEVTFPLNVVSRTLTLNQSNTWDG